MDIKLSIHFGEDKTKSILFYTKRRKRKIGTLGIQYGDVKIKQYSKVIYLRCELDESLSGEAMALKVINKINSRLKFLYRKNRYLTPYDIYRANTRSSVLKLKQSFKKHVFGSKKLSYLTPTVSNKLLTDLKLAKSINNLKHKLKEHFFKKRRDMEQNIFAY